MRRIVECDACAGLPEEAHALAAVTDAYSRLPNPDVAKFHATLRKAYITAHGGNTDFDDHVENRHLRYSAKRRNTSAKYFLLQPKSQMGS